MVMVIALRSTFTNLDYGMINRAMYQENSCAKEVSVICGNFTPKSGNIRIDVLMTLRVS